MMIADGIPRPRFGSPFLALKDFAAGGAKLVLVLLQARDDPIRDRYEIFAKAINVGLASCLLILCAWFGHRIRCRETKRCRHGNPRRIPHHQIPS
jgi:hypothetical protein